MPDFLLPDLGEGLNTAEVVAWHVAPGDRVAVDQVIAEVETAKAVAEVPVQAQPGDLVLVLPPGYLRRYRRAVPRPEDALLG